MLQDFVVLLIVCLFGLYHAMQMIGAILHLCFFFFFFLFRFVLFNGGKWKKV